MEFTFRCNITKCRTELQHQAVVTTCSHIFCIQCASSSSLANAVGGARVCPACQAQLVNKDDAVITQLDPSEDYKTSVLSGFTPTLVVECASRALNFYNYQAVHEATYQEFLARRLTEKVTGLNSQLDETINNANGHILKLQEALKESQGQVLDLENKNMEVQNAFKQKAKALNEVTRKYEHLKSEKMAAQTMNAASDEAEQMVQSMQDKRFSSQYNPMTANNFRRPISASSDGSRDNIRRLHSLQRHPQQGHVQNRNFAAQEESVNNNLFMVPSTIGRSIDPSGVTSRTPYTMSADGAAPINRQPLGNLPTNSYRRQSNSAYGTSVGAKAVKRPLRSGAATPRIDRHTGPSAFPMR